MDPRRDDPRAPLWRALNKLGFLASALGVFTAGYYAMKTEDWRRITVLTLLAGVAGVLASAFQRRSR